MSYFPEQKKILLIQKSLMIQAHEDSFHVYSYMIDFKNYKILRFKHKRDVVQAGIHSDSSIWLDIGGVGKIEVSEADLELYRP